MRQPAVFHVSGASTSTKIQERALRQYEADVEEKKSMRTTRVHDLGEKLDHNNRRLIEEAPGQRAAMNIQRLFANGVAYELSTREGVSRPKAFKAFQNRVMKITVVPKFVGSKSAYDVAYILMRA